MPGLGHAVRLFRHLVDSRYADFGRFSMSHSPVDLPVFPPEPPVADPVGQNGAQLARARVRAAQRTLAGEHRSGIHWHLDGRRSGYTGIPAGGL